MNSISKRSVLSSRGFAPQCDKQSASAEAGTGLGMRRPSAFVSPRFKNSKGGG